MNKILVSTDFSEYSDYALENASFFAKKIGGELTILHIIKNEKKIDRGEVKEKLKALKDLPFLKGVKVHFLLKKGSSVSKIINKTANSIGIDLIIMGTNGTSNTEGIILGSTTENVIRKSEINVLTVKREIITFELNHILFPSDFSKESYTIFETVKNYAKIFNATIHLLRVNKSEKSKLLNKTTYKMDRFIKHYQLIEEGIKFKKSVCSNVSAEFGILNYSVDNDIDLIAIGTHGKGVLKKLIQESTSQRLVRDAFKPVLTMRFKKIN